MRYPLRPETIEKISAAQTSALPTTSSQDVTFLQDVIRNAENWRAYCFVSGKLAQARTTAVMIGVKRSQLHRMMAGK